MCRRQTATQESLGRGKPVIQAQYNDFSRRAVLGAGRYGKVVLVVEKSSGDAVHAMKTFSKAASAEVDHMKNALNERRILELAQHQFIVNMNYAFQTQQELCLLLEFCQGGDLFFHLNRDGAFTVPRSRFYSSEMTLALGYLHSLDIIYRDLKPENVVLNADGHVKLADFGSSKFMCGETSTMTWCGTLEYMSPEILEGRSYGKAVDWYAVGAVTYAMLTGRPPFYTRRREQMIENIKKGQLQYPRNLLPPQAANFIQLLLIRNPSERLGGGGGDVEEVKCHEFWSGLDWIAMEERRVAPPFVPTLSSIDDTKYFSSEFLTLPPVESVNSSRPAHCGDHVECWTFPATNVLVKPSKPQVPQDLVTSVRASKALLAFSLICGGQPLSMM